MASKNRSDAKASDICGTCRGTGEEVIEVAELIRDPKKGEDIMITRKKTKTCSQCKGLGEYPTL